MISINVPDPRFCPERRISFTFRDPDKPGGKNIYCVGLEWNSRDRALEAVHARVRIRHFLNSNQIRDPRKWEHDHTNYWDHSDPIDPRVISRDKLDSVLERHQTSFEMLLREFIERIAN